MIKVVFISPDGLTQHECNAEIGDTLLDVAQNNDIDIEGACEGNMACSTCHVIVEDAWFGKLPSPKLEENEMLDLAPGLCATSRLGCQIILAEAHDGLVVKLPKETANAGAW